MKGVIRLRKRWGKMVSGTAVAGLALGLALSPVEAMDMVGWEVKGGGAGIFEGARYSLYNLDQRLHLEEKDRTGANLGWTSGPNGHMKVQRVVPSTGPLRCGERFGLFIEKEWVIYDQQTTGINLSTRTQLKPHDAAYQWEFTGCPAGVVPLNAPVTLKNIRGNDSVVGCKRIWGVNLCWANDVTTIRGQNYRRMDVPGLGVVIPRGVEGQAQAEVDDDVMPPQEDVQKWLSEKLTDVSDEPPSSGAPGPETK